MNTSSTLKRIAALAVALLAAIVLAACGGAWQADAPGDGAAVRGAGSATAAARPTIAQDSQGAPPLPEGLQPLSAIQRAMPFGLTGPGLELDVPFDGKVLEPDREPALLVAQPGGVWMWLPDAQRQPATEPGQHRMRARVPQLGYAVVVQGPARARERVRAGMLPTLSPHQPRLSLNLASAQPALESLPASSSLWPVDAAYAVRLPTQLSLALRAEFEPACEPMVTAFVAWSQVVDGQVQNGLQTLFFQWYRQQGASVAQADLPLLLDASWQGREATTFAVANCVAWHSLWADDPFWRLHVMVAAQSFHVDIAAASGPVIQQPPADVSVREGQPVGLQATASGQAPLAYEWQVSRDGGTTWAPAGAAAARIEFIAALADDGSLWRVRVTDAQGRATTSAPARLTVTAEPAVLPSFSASPADMAVQEGQAASFVVAVQGTPAPSLRWQSRAPGRTLEQDWQDLTGATGTSLNTAPATLADDGRQYRAVATNAAGSVASTAATLRVTARIVAPGITRQPAPAEVVEGASAAFSIQAQGTGPLGYQWFKDGVPLPGANAADVLLPTTAADAGKTLVITVQVSNSAGSVTSDAASLVVKAASSSTVSALFTVAQGGSLTTPDGGVTLELPPGALAADATLTLQALSPANFTLPEGATPVGPVIAVGPAGASFARPVGIAIPTPQSLPDGMALAIIELPAGTERPLALRAGMRGLRARAAADANGANAFSCLQAQASAGGLSFAALPTSARAVFVQVPSATCSIIGAPLLQEVGVIGKVPSDTTAACGPDGDFIRPFGIDEFLGQLVNRHVACGRFQETGLDVDVPAKDANGAPYLEPKAAKMDLDVMWSIHGPSSGLQKTLTLKIRQTLALTSTGLPAGTPVPAVQARVLAECDSDAASPRVNCGGNQAASLANNGTMTLSLPITAQWLTAERAWAEFVPRFRLMYASDGQAPDVEVSGRTGQVSRGLQVKVRCDDGMARAGTRGCVLPDAAPVLVLYRSDGPDAVDHMREAMDPNGPIKAPGHSSYWQGPGPSLRIRFATTACSERNCRE